MRVAERGQIRVGVESSDGTLARVGAALADWSARWFPDSFIFALIAVAIVFVAGLFLGTSVQDLAAFYGQGFWSLIPFTMQMAMIIIGGYVVATSPPVHRLIRRLAGIPQTPRGAIAFVAFFSLTTSLISWGLSLIFSGLLTREVVKNIRGIDYRAIGAAAFLGFTTIGGLGLSSTVGLLMATPSSIPPALLAITGPIPLSQTIFTWQSLTVVVIVFLSSLTIAYLSAPKNSARTAESFGVTEDLASPELEKKGERHSAAEWLEEMPFLSIVIGVLGLAYLAQVFLARGVAAALDLNTYNFLFLMAGLLLHWRPRSFIAAVNNSVPATAGVLLMFPFYAGILGMVTGSPIARDLARFFVHISTHNTFPIVVAIYTFILGLFVPSGGSKWVIEAPYILQAGKELQIPLNWVVQIYNASQPVPNWVNPFFMLPLLGILKIKARDIIGFGLLQLASSLVLVLFFSWYLARTFH
jgi:short-chain fatty acids transporter